MNAPATRGFTLLFVLIVLIALSALAVGAAILLRPATLGLDLHEQLARAQLAADAALEESLSRLDAGRAAFFTKVQTDFEQSSAEKALGETEREILAAGRLRVFAPDGVERWATVRIGAAVVRAASGRWKVTRYRIEKSGFE